MKPETQVKIGRITALLLVVIHLVGPVIRFIALIRGLAVKVEISPKVILLTLMVVCLSSLPLIAVAVGLYWSLLRKKLKAAIVFFVIEVLWGLYSVTRGGGLMLVIEIIVMLLLLQGILGIRRLRAKTITK